MKPTQKFKIKIGVILGLIAGLLLILPLFAFGFLKIYQNELIKQTESELIAQATVVTEFLKSLPIYNDKEMVAKECERLSNSNVSFGRRFALIHQSIDPEGNWENALLPAINLHSIEIETPLDLNATRPWIPTPFDLNVKSSINDAIVGTAEHLLSGMRVLNSKGIVVSSSNEEALGLYLGESLEFKAAQTGLAGSVLRRRISDNHGYSISSMSRNSDVRVFVSKPILVDENFCGTVIVSRTPQSVGQALYPNRYLIGIVGGVVVLFSFFMIRFLAITLKRPLETLSREAITIKNGADLTRFSESGFLISEIDSLGKSLEEMAKNLRERAKAIQYFTSHISHELKTPLTSLMGASEILDSHPEIQSSKDLQRFVKMIHQDGQRMQLMLNDLRRYSQIDFLSLHSLMQTKISLGSLKEFLKEKFKDEKPSLSFLNFDQNTAYLLPRDIVVPVLEQLIQNAYKHGEGATQIVLSVAHPSPENSNKVIFHVKNTGSAIPDEVVKNIFDPFFTTSGLKGGTGMGLPIARKLVELCGGTLQLSDNQSDFVAFRFEINYQ